MTEAVTAHSGLYAMSSEVSGQGITGLRLAVPTGATTPAAYSLSAWAYVDEHTESNSSCFFGFAFGEDYPNSTTGWSQMLGWEVNGDALSTFQLAGAQQPTSAGIPQGGWHLVEVEYERADNTLRVSLDSQSVGTIQAPGAAGQAASYVVLGALGAESGAVQHVYFDDVVVELVGGAEQSQTRPFALLEGPEQVAQNQQRSYTVQYGNGYPMLGMEDIAEILPDSLYVGVSLPDGYSLVSADPAPSRENGGTVVWEMPMPESGQGGYLHLEVQTPTGLSAPMLDRIWAWVTDDSGVAFADPPNPPVWAYPCDAIWGCPQDLLPQEVALGPVPDLWVRKSGPPTASPGDIINYVITVGNSGSGAAEDVSVRDVMPEELGGGDRVVAVIDALAPGDTWRGTTGGELPWGTEQGTLLLNHAYVPTASAEVVTENNASDWETTTVAARDPNQITVSPEGGVSRGALLSYTLECENEGAGTAYGVYATARLDSQLDDTTLLVSDPDALSYDSMSRTLMWQVGTLAAGEGASVSFSVRVAGNARRARPVIEQAVVYFPSVPEETPTNIVMNVVNSTFSDIPWNHWAVLPIEQTYENEIVRGYDDGTYRPSVPVDRGQMAVYIARALAGGDANVPTGPASPTFPDVDTEHWAYDYVEYVHAQDVVQGYDDGTYRPTMTVDRGQMAVYIARALAGGDSGVPADPTTPTFADVTPDGDWAWCYLYVEYVVSEGVVGGYPDGTYRPEYEVTRDQMAVYVQRAFRLPM